MKFLSIVLLVTLALSCSCLSKNKLKKFKQQLITVPENLETYPEAIMAELNQFLTLYQQPELQWSEPLKGTAKQAADDILLNQNFGQHSQIEKWQAQIPNDIFTEMCFNVNVTNSNYYSKALSQKTSKVMYDTKLSVGTIMKTVSAPSAQMFAKNIIESLESEHLLLSLNQYTHCGIAISPMDQEKYPNEYLAVMHLIKENSGEKPEQISELKSCKDALAVGNKDPQITIKVNGEDQLVKCDQESHEGGWTLIYSVNKDFTKDPTNKFSDLNLDYTEIFVQTKQDHYSEFGANTWHSDGWNYVLNVLRFGETWYASEEAWYPSEETPTIRVLFDEMPNHGKFRMKNQVQRFEQSSKCQFNGINHFQSPGYCGYSFILKKQEGGGLNAISDLESVTSSRGNIDNKYHYDLDIYVR